MLLSLSAIFTNLQGYREKKRLPSAASWPNPRYILAQGRFWFLGSFGFWFLGEVRATGWVLMSCRLPLLLAGLHQQAFRNLLPAVIRILGRI